MGLFSSDESEITLEEWRYGVGYEEAVKDYLTHELKDPKADRVKIIDTAAAIFKRYEVSRKKIEKFVKEQDELVASIANSMKPPHLVIMSDGKKPNAPEQVSGLTRKEKWGKAVMTFARGFKQYGVPQAIAISNAIRTFSGLMTEQEISEICNQVYQQEETENVEE